MMKRRFIYVIGALLLLTGCEFHASENGDLDGLWQLTQVDTLTTGGVEDMRYSQVSWAFQGHLMEMRKPLLFTYEGDILARFDHTRDSLVVYDCYISKRDMGDIPVTKPEDLYPYGLRRLTERFRVMVLNDSRMTLRSDSLQLYFRRY
jgi:hypothetical protein